MPGIKALVCYNLYLPLLVSLNNCNSPHLMHWLVTVKILVYNLQQKKNQNTTIQQLYIPSEDAVATRHFINYSDYVYNNIKLKFTSNQSNMLRISDISCTIYHTGRVAAKVLTPEGDLAQKPMQ